MKKKASPLDMVIYTVLILFMMMALIDSTYKFVGFKYNTWLYILIIAGVTLYLFTTSRYKYAWFALILLFLLPEPLYIIKFFKYIISGFGDFFNSLLVNMYVDAAYLKYFNSMMIIIVPAAAALFYLIIVVRRNAIAVISLGCAAIASYFLMGQDNLAKDCNYFLIASMILYGYNNYKINWSKLKNENVRFEKGYYPRLIGATIVLVLVASFLARILPLDRKPVSFNWFENNILTKLDDLRGREVDTLSTAAYQSQFDLSHTGFQQDSRRLGGPVVDDNSLALKVKSTDDIGKIHLRGSVRDVYNGYMWTRSDDQTVKLKGEFNIQEFSPPYIYKTIDILHEKIKTTTAFNVLYPYTLDNGWGYAFIDSDLEIFNPRVLRQGRGYSVKFKEYNIDQQVMLNPAADASMIGSDDMKKYLALPNELPSRVVELTNKITDKYDTPYMKVSAIENYLKKNYPYDKNTSILPEGRDFVDYFLFDEKKGSCTYYATAMAVMSRIAGVPSRYVEGFVVPYGKDIDGYTEILNSDAHAWVELYFNDIGWVTFDPTPGWDSPSYKFDTSTSNDQNNDPGSITPGNNTNPNQGKKPNEGDTGDDMQTGGDAVSSHGPSWVMVVLIVLLSIIAMAVLILIILFIIYLFINRDIRKHKRFIQYSIYKIICYGKLLNYPYRNGETLREYFERLSKKVDINLNPYILIYETTLYAEHSLNKSEVKELIKAVDKLKKLTIQSVGRYKYLYWDCINTYTFYARKQDKK